jgi:antitoxin ParD1/3/4
MWYDFFTPPVRAIIMSTIAKRTISLPQDQAAFLDAQIAKGTYASVSEVVRAGLRALQERDLALERWLRDEVAATYDAMQADPTRARSAEDVMRSLRARHADRLKAERS